MSKSKAIDDLRGLSTKVKWGEVLVLTDEHGLKIEVGFVEKHANWAKVIVQAPKHIVIAKDDRGLIAKDIA